MKRIILYIISGIILLLLVACIADDYGNKTGVVSKNGFMLVISIPGSDMTRATTVPAKDGEDEVHSLYLLFFEYTTGGTGTFIDYYDASPEYGSPITSHATLEIDLSQNSNLNKSTSYNILLVANIEDYLRDPVEQWFERMEGYSQNDIMTSYLAYVTKGSGFNSSSPAFKPHLLPMSAVMTRTPTEETLSVELIRLVSRFDITCYPTGYKMVSASIWNGYPEASIWDNEYFSYKRDRITRLYGIEDVSNNVIEGGLYSFINYVANPEQDDILTTCIILGIEYNGNVTYYRVNLNRTTASQQLKRNNAYHLRINDILGPGENTEEDAYRSKDFNLDIKINEWSVDDQGCVLVDGDNLLVLPATIISFTPKGETREFNIFTYGEGYLEMSQNELPAGLAATLKGHDLTVTATDSEDSKSGYIEIKFGRLKGIITINQQGANDEYLELSTNKILVFPREQDYEYPEDIIVTSSGDWKATVYNQHFSLKNKNNLHEGEEIEGESKHSFSVKTLRDNPDPKVWYSFVLISLKNNQEVQRTLVLAQNSSGGIRVEPETQETIYFDANGNPIGNATFTVTTDSEDWEAILMGTNASSFDIEADLLSQDKFTVKGELNINPVEQRAAVRIRLKSNHTVYREIQIHQERHSLQLNPTTVGSVEYPGGKSDNITVYSSGPWTAEVIGTNCNPVFTGDNISTQISGSGQGVFSVTFTKNLNGHISPKAEVKVTLDGTNISETITITQQRPVFTAPLKFHGKTQSYGSLVEDNHYIQQFRKNMLNISYFGPSGKVYQYNPGFTFTSGTTFSAGSDIVCWSEGALTAKGAELRNWIRDPDNDKRVLLVWGDLQCETMMAALNMGYTGIARGNGTSNTSVHSINTPVDIQTNKLLLYLLKDGPFTKGTMIERDQIALYCLDRTNGVLSDWPDTMVPIMMDPDNPQYMVLGIDPVERLIFCGNTEIFHNSGANSRNNFTGTYGNNNDAFLNNLIAWMINAARFGSLFTEDFVDD